MDNLEPTIEDEVNDISMGRPHVVLLGAGASRAAFPNGDKNGKVLPLMDDLIEILHLDKALKKAGIDYEGKNFEEIYSNLCSDEKMKSILTEVEGIIFDYFAALELPDEPTLYDYIALSLRDKDLVATFNWDPLLYLAFERCQGLMSLPKIAFLHGNVAIAPCLKCRVKMKVGHRCPNCDDVIKPSKLLFPIKQKNYSQDDFIKSEWEGLKKYLENAYLFTIFGYSAPESDVEAIEILKGAWGDVSDRSFEQVEIIHRPGANPDEVSKIWSNFIHSHHYDTEEDFFSSWMARHPRRSCEALWNTTMEVKFLLDNNPPRDVSLGQLKQWYIPLHLVEENKNNESKDN